MDGRKERFMRGQAYTGDDAKGIRRVLGLIALLLLLGCSGGGGGNAARLIIETDTTSPLPFDEIEVSITASRTPEGNLCEPAIEKFTIEGEGDLPLVVDYVFGSEYRSWVAFKVVCYSAGSVVLRKEVASAFFSGVRNEITLLIEDACFSMSCGLDQQCLDGICVDLPDPGPFNEPLLLDFGTTCDSSG